MWPEGEGRAAAPTMQPSSRRRSLVIAAAVSAVGVAIPQAYVFLARGLTINESYAAFLGLQVSVIGLFVLAARLEGRPLRDLGFAVRGSPPTVLVLASVLAMAYLALRIDPGFVFGFGKTPLEDPWVFGFLLFSAPLVALAELGLFFGYLLRTLTRTLPLRAAMLLSAAAFALYSTNFPSLFLLGRVAAVEYLFTATMVAFVLGITLALYTYKSQWSLVGPYAFLTAILALGWLLPVGASYPSWDVDFVSSLAACAVVLIIVGIGLREPRLQALHYLGERMGPRRFRFRQRVRGDEATRTILMGSALAGVIAISFVYGLPTVLGTPQPVLAIATGSMVPTLERGTLVVIEHVSAPQITVGTIIAFHVACLPAPTVHRVIRIVHPGPNWVFQTKGDANPSQDPCTVPYSAVLGAVVLIVPYVGLMILDPLFAAAVVVLVVVIPLAWREVRS